VRYWQRLRGRYERQFSLPLQAYTCGHLMAAIAIIVAHSDFITRPTRDAVGLKLRDLVKGGIVKTASPVPGDTATHGE